MKSHWRKLLALLPESVERKAFESFFKKEDEKLKHNNPISVTSNLAKQEVLKHFQQKYQLKTLVETGTYLGDTIFSMYPFFETLYSIELSEYYFNKAKLRFKNYPKLNLIHGDSGKQLHQLVPQLKSPALFWLDGHYSGGLTAKGDKDCPVYEELNAIFSSQLPHVIVIDDARLFIGKNDYPTLDELKNYVNTKRPAYKFSVENDSLRILPA